MSQAATQPKSHRRLWLYLLAALIIILLLAYLLDLDEVLKELRKADWRTLLYAAGFLLVGYVSLALRWRYILLNNPGMAPSFHSNNISNLITILTPIPAVALRVVSIAEITTVTYGEAIPGMAVDRLSDTVMRIISLVIVIILATGRRLTAETLILTAGVIGLLLGLFILLAHNGDKVAERITGWLSRFPQVGKERVSRALSGLVRGLDQIGSTRHLIVALLLSLVMWIFFLLFQLLCWEAMNLRLSAAEMIILSLGVLVVAPPSAPAMPGVYQSIVIAVLSLVGITSIETNTAYGIITWVVMLLCLLVLGGWGLMRTDLKLKHLASEAQELLGQHHQQEESANLR
jgi:uncharacterized protein (TIRG00374 family)